MRETIRKFATALALTAVMATQAPAATTTWQIDPAHTAAQFAVKHLMISTVRGEFKNVTGTVKWDDADITKSTVDVTIDAKTVNTGEPNRDQDLKSEKFFDVEKFPTMTFKSKKVESAGTGKLKVTGDLTIHGVTKEVVLNVEGPTQAVKDPWGNTRAAVSATTQVNRQDYGVKWNANMDGGGVVVGDTVNITIDLEMVKQAAK
ncbi:MAG TPA: YceI family protein [Candidatus Dormibacteraeota bacterium]|jgi:polyisoprenoid-binding protein YceI|nr:YceI family protein [Candidatus Dormibacteraeota bacterium]